MKRLGDYASLFTSSEREPFCKEVGVAVEQLRKGKPVIIFDSEDRESEGDIAFAAKYCTPELVNLCLHIGRGLICVSMYPDYAQKRGIMKLPSNALDKYATPFGMPISLADGSSGISAMARSATIRKLADSYSKPSDFCFPGHTHTLIAHPNGLAGRNGHTEAVLDLLKFAGIDGPGVLCEVLVDDGRTANLDELHEISKNHHLPLIRLNAILH